VGNCLLHKARQKVNINLNCTIKNNTQQDFSALEGLMNDFFPFAQEQIGFNKPVDVVLQSSLENSEDPLGKTGYYDPSGFQIVIFTDNRHPKDMLRSFSHELVHHGQNCNGQFEDIGSTEHGYAQSDPHLRSMEEDAFTRGNMIFRDWCDTCGSDNQLNETNYKKQGKTKMKINQSKIINIIKEELKKRSLGEQSAGTHSCASHVKENATGREGRPINHTLLEDGTVTHYTVEYENEIVEGVPSDKLTMLEIHSHGHRDDKPDSPHDKKKKRRRYKEEELKETEEAPLKEWFNESLYTRLIEKYTRKNNENQ